MNSSKKCHTAFVWSDEFESFDTGDRHPVRRGRFRAIRDYLHQEGFFEFSHILELEPDLLSEELLFKIHSKTYINKVKEISQTGHGKIDIDTPGFLGIYETARSQCGGTVAGVEQIMTGSIDHFISPTGGFHHAFYDRGGGFCVFNDIAATVVFLKSFGINRVLVVDTDVHHGNGIQDYFYERSDVLFISLHEDPEWMYPHTGAIEEIGAGSGIGYNVNVPLPMDSGDAVYRYAFDEIVKPLSKCFQPEFILFLPGFDTHYLDPLAHMATTTEFIRYSTSFLHDLAHQYCDGRLGIVSGGGYHGDALCWGIATVMSVLSGITYKPPKETPPMVEDEEVWAEVKETIARLKELIFPFKISSI